MISNINSDYPGEVDRFPHPRVCSPAVSLVLREVATATATVQFFNQAVMSIRSRPL